MKPALAQAVRKNRVAAMAQVGASSDAWAEVLLSAHGRPDTNHLSELQAWCRRAAEDAANRRLIDSAEQWAGNLADREQASMINQSACASASALKPASIESEQQWVLGQMSELPPPSPEPGWALHATLLDLAQYALVHPHRAFDVQEWHEELSQLVAQEAQTRQQRGDRPEDIDQALCGMRAALEG
jgi:hypothetical protein